MALLNKLKL